MSLKEKIKPLFFALSLFIGVFVFFNNVSAFGNGVPISLQNYTFNVSDGEYYIGGGAGITITGTNNIYSNTSCNYISENDNYYLSVVIRDSNDNIVHAQATNVFGGIFSDRQTNGINSNLSVGYLSDYSTTGNYYLSIEPFNPNTQSPNSTQPYWTTCGNPLAFGFMPFYVDKENNTMTPIEPPSSVIEGVCGEAQGATLTTIPPDASYACASGNFINFAGGYTNELQTEIRYDWLCEGSGGGSSSACYSAIVETPINGVCGSNDGGTFSELPITNRCETGNEQGSLLQTLEGWTWSCYGYNGGTTDNCSAIYSEAETPPTIPDTSVVPTPTDCDTFSGIDKIFCNFGNTIQGMFLPSTDKITELQTTLNKVGNVFPFNYLRVISSIFSRETVTQGSLTLTMWGNTETISASYWELPIFEKVRLFATILVLLMFTFWAIGYIKHFFK
jgi:hypothetical protein